MISFTKCARENQTCKIPFSHRSGGTLGVATLAVRLSFADENPKNAVLRIALRREFIGR
jgi:hypothetical protein